MKKMYLLLVVTLVTLTGFSQSEKGYVYLKNGSVLKGKYAYLENKQKVKIETSGNIWIFKANEIDSISSKRIRTLSDTDKALTNSKFFYRAELGVLVGNAENSQSAPFSMYASANYLFYSKLSAGLGVGAEFFNETYMPVLANIEYRLKASSSSPYAFLKIGYQVPLEKSNAIYYDVCPIWSSFAPWPGEYGQEGFDTKGGVLINPGLGYQQMFTSGFGMTFAAGYQFHRLNYQGENDYSLDIDYNRLTLKVGIIFN